MRGLAFAGLVLLPLLCTAEIFQRHPGGSVCQRLGFTRAYQAPVNINGGKAHVDVWSSPDSYYRTMSRLQDLCRAKGWAEGFTAGEKTGFGMAIAGEDLLRWLVVKIDDAGKPKTIVYQTTQALSEFHKGDKRAGPAGAEKKHRLTKVPAYDNSTPATFIADENTRTTIEVSHSPQVAELVQVWFDRKMSDDGWIQGAASTADARIYARGEEKAMISIRNDDERRRAVITRVYKRRADVK